MPAFKKVIYNFIDQYLNCMSKTIHSNNTIRNPQANKLSSESQGFSGSNLSELKQSPDANSLNQLISMLTTLVSANISSKRVHVNPKHQYQLEARDREVCIDLPTARDKVKLSELKLWITDVVKTTFSSAFNSFSKNQMSFEQAKIYCSENIFKNIVRLSQKHRLSKQELQQIDNHIKKGVLNYLEAKYPLTDQTLVNKKLQAAVRQMDNMESLSNNYFTNSKIVFELRQSGNYNDLIMEMLNDLMSKLDMESKEKATNYQDFQKYMSDIFQKVEDQDWTNQLGKEHSTQQPNKSYSQNIDINQKNNGADEKSQEMIKIMDEKEKYKTKVKEYTQYSIGRKISEDARRFTPAEIENGNIQIKNPQILRILTKWCEELQEKYSNSYFSSRSQSIKSQRGQKINSLLAWMRAKLDQTLKTQKKFVNKTMNELIKNNYEMQASVLQNELERQGDEHIDEIQKISGKFSHKVVKNLHQYIIIYLNKLIHGLLKAASILLFERIGKGTTQSSPPNLLSFSIGDLMRCKCSSKEKEIIRIYEEINRISKENPEKLKIVRIKNRLRSGTNDILMNVRFNDSILCEIQLAIKTTASEFIKCSNKFHHYIYELQRSLFGPLTQLGSIWNSLDKRADIYEELVEQEQNESKVLFEHDCLQRNKNDHMKPYYKSFVCSSGKLSYFHNRFIIGHVQCTTCSYIRCAKCRIEEQAKNNLKGLLGKQQKFMDMCGKIVSKDSELPNFGLCVLIESEQLKVEPFTLITYRDIDYLLSEKESGINQISRIRSKKEKAKFRNNYLLFNVKNDRPFKQIQQKQAINKYILPLVMKQNYKKQKETISLMDMKLSNKECRQILSVGSHSQKQCVKNIFLTDNLLTELPFNPKQFPNAQWITLSHNKMESLKGIEQIHHLNKLALTNCGVWRFPEVFECKGLKYISLHGNHISQIDNRISNLTNLEGLYLKGNQIITIPQNIGELKKLKEISLTKNENITSLPSRFAELKNLQFINISHTLINEIPCPQEGFAQLRGIKIQNTKVKNFPIGFQKSLNIQVANFSSLPGLSFDNLSFENIKTLEMRNCGFTEMPSIIQNMKNLRTLDLSENKIEDWKDSFNQLKLLQNLYLNSCCFTNLPNLSICCNLKFLTIQSNRLTSIPAENIEGLVNLQKFNCFDNLLTVLPRSLMKLKKLRALIAGKNNLETLFDPEFQSAFDGTQYWPKLSYADLNNNNKLHTIPLPLYYCPKLEYLNITNININLIPPKIKHSFRIKKLILSNNSISEIPEELSALTQLQKLDLNHNPIVRIPLFVQDFTKLTRFYCNNETIQTIQCLDWMLNNSTIDFGPLKAKSEEMKKKQLEAQKMKSLDQNP